MPNTFKYALIIDPAATFVIYNRMDAGTDSKVPRTIMALALYTPSMVGPVFITVVFRTLFSGDEAGYINAILIRLELIDQPIQFLLSPDYIMNIMIFVSCGVLWV